MILDLQYNEPVFRPPSEANSLILQATLGCSHNRCAFCGMYKMKEFRIRKFEDFRKDVEIVKAEYPGVRRVFLADGDALAVKTPTLQKELRLLYHSFPKLERVTTYANPSNLLHKSDAELKILREEGLKILYLGVETGDEELLARIDKGATRAEVIEAGRKAITAGFELSVTVILGIGGRERSERHARATATILNEIQPHYIGALTLMLGPFEGYFKSQAGEKWAPLERDEFLRELRMLVEGLEMEKECMFRTNHASNYLALGGTLPQDKEALLETIDYALKNPQVLRPEHVRAL
ncbi:MAG: radical SAM protein [Proteobacteria bacterium]|nr:radical SAM protein [Pseudomonadota bacterium]